MNRASSRSFLISMPRFVPGRALGAETYLAGLLSGLAAASTSHRISLQLCEAAVDWASSISPNFRLLPTRPLGRGVLDLMTGVETSRCVADTAADAVLFPLNLAPSVRVPSVLYVHDLVARYYMRNFPAYRPAHMRLQSWFLDRSIRQATVIGCPTQAVADEIAAVYGPDAGRVRVVPEAVLGSALPLETADPAPGLGGRPFILQASSSLPHKDHATGVRAFAKARARLHELGLDPALVITGEAHSAYAGLSAVISEFHIEESVIFAGRVDRAGIAWLMRNAICHLMPTLYEGFGLGVVEAQALGCPVVASDLPVLREVSGGSALFFTAGSADSAAEALVRLMSEPRLREGLATAGPAAAARFTWDGHARDLLHLLERACALEPAS